MADENAATERTVLGRSKIFTPEVIDDIHVRQESLDDVQATLA